MKFSRKALFMAFVCFVTVLSSCQKEESLNNQITNSSQAPLPKVFISANEAKVSPVQSTEGTSGKYEKMQIIQLTDAHLRDAEGKEYHGDVEWVRFYRKDGSTLSTIKINEELLLANEILFEANKIVELKTNRRMLSIGIFCMAYSAQVYDEVYEHLIRTRNVACDFCAYAKSREAYVDCLSGNVKNSYLIN